MEWLLVTFGDVNIEISPLPQAIEVDKPLYKPGQTVNIRAIVRGTKIIIL